MDQWIRDGRVAVRGLIKAPSLTVAAILALCLAIGANTAVYSVIHALQSFPLPVSDPDRLVLLFQENAEQKVQQGGISVDDFLDYRRQMSSFESMILAAPQPFSLDGIGAPARVQGVRVTPGFFDTLGLQPLMGRGLSDGSGEAAAAREVVISYGFWAQSFAGESPLGRELRLDGVSHTVVGVAPEDFFFINPQTAVWTALDSKLGSGPRDQRTQVALARLADGVDSGQAQAEASNLAERLAGEYPATNRGWTARVLTLEENLNQGTRFVRALLYASITFVLLIACVNVANLLLARGLSREREVAMRSSLGASRLALFRQHLVESLVLALSAGVLGLGLGWLGVEVLRDWIAPDPNIGFISQWIRLDLWVTLHALGISIFAGVFFGTTPALQALAKIDLGSMLKEGGRSGDGRVRQALRSGLVMGEVALALALLITAATLIRAFQSIYEADPGFDTASLLTLQVILPDADYPLDADKVAFFEQARAELDGLPGIESVASTTVLPLTQFAGPGDVHVQIEGHGDVAEDRAPNASRVVVSEGYIETLGLQLMRGRAFEASDRVDGRPVAMINETFARRFLGDEPAVGRGLRLVTQTAEEAGPWHRIVGVVADHDSHAHSLRRPSRPPLVFVPERQGVQSAVTLVARTRVPPEETALAAREALWQLDPSLPVDPVRSLEQAVAQIDTQNIFFLKILSGLALVAFVLAAVGIYGIVSYSVSRKTREIGIRAALGANPSTTLRWVTAQAAWLTAVGLGIGCGIAWLLVRFMSNQLEGIGQTRAGGPTTFLLVAAAFLLVAVLSSGLPAMRAVRVDPVRALRDD